MKPSFLNQALELSKANKNPCRRPNFGRVPVMKQFWFYRTKVRPIDDVFRLFDSFVLRGFFQSGLRVAECYRKAMQEYQFFCGYYCKYSFWISFHPKKGVPWLTFLLF